MSLSRSFLLASVLPVVLAKAAYATTISTPSVIPDDNGTFFCLVTNVSAKTLDIQIDVFDMNGGTSGHFGFVTRHSQHEPRSATARPAIASAKSRLTAAGTRSGPQSRCCRAPLRSRLSIRYRRNRSSP